MKFEFSVDYFASAADGRWWHDHRIPGGIAFTANSLGHMMKVNEWYLREGSQAEWALRTAMLTIASAKQTNQGPATWLLDEGATGPFKAFDWHEDTPLPDIEKIKGRDHGSYGGHLHTDHAVRVEFFANGELPPRKDKPWAMDLSYIFDLASPDHNKFVEGSPVSEEIVNSDIGRPADWRVIAVDDEVCGDSRLGHVVKEIQELLQVCRTWAVCDDETAAGN